jgi:hypothetical protein
LVARELIARESLRPRKTRHIHNVRALRLRSFAYLPAWRKTAKLFGAEWPVNTAEKQREHGGASELENREKDFEILLSILRSTMAQQIREFCLIVRKDGLAHRYSDVYTLDLQLVVLTVAGDGKKGDTKEEENKC